MVGDMGGRGLREEEEEEEEGIKEEKNRCEERG